MSKMMKALLTAALPALLGTPLYAQTGIGYASPPVNPGPTGIPAGQMGSAGPLSMPLLFTDLNVQRELNISPVAMTGLRNSFNQEQLNLQNQLNQLDYQYQLGQVSQTGPNSYANLRNNLIQNYHSQVMSTASSLLTPQQINRYQQVQIQAQGFNAFNDPAVQSQLNLNNDQVTQLQNQASRPGTGRSLFHLHRIQRVLNPAQVQAYRRMVGQPFQFSAGLNPYRYGTWPGTTGPATIGINNGTGR